MVKTKVYINGKSLGVHNPGGAVKVATKISNDLTDCDGLDVKIFYPGEKFTYLKKFTAYRIIWEQVVFPLLMLFRKGVILSLTNSYPLLIKGSRQVVLLHDTGFTNTEWFSKKFSLYMRFLTYLGGWKKVNYITVSKSAVDDIKKEFKRIQNVNYIYNSIISPPEKNNFDCARKDYFLFIGSLNPRKNLTTLLQAFTLYKKSGGEKRLIVVGAEKKIFKKSEFTSQDLLDVEFVGYVTEETKWGLIYNSCAVVIPSILEGFCIPALEAVYAGKKVVLSDIKVFHELYEKLPIYVDPNSSESIKNGLFKVDSHVVDNNEYCEVMKKFDWARAVKEYNDIITNLDAS